MMSIEMQLREVARCYLKLKKIGLKPRRSFSSLARQHFHATDLEVDQAMHSAHNFMSEIGIPRIQDELSSPCHKRP